MVFQAYRSVHADSFVLGAPSSVHRRFIKWLGGLSSRYVVPYGRARSDYSAAYRDCLAARSLGFACVVFCVNPTNNN